MSPFGHATWTAGISRTAFELGLIENCEDNGVDEDVYGCDREYRAQELCVAGAIG